MKCPKCGNRDEFYESDIDQDERGNYLSGVFCVVCDELLVEQSEAGQCLHVNVEREPNGYWCVECGNYMGERYE